MLGEARTRILLLYLVIMLVFVTTAVPIFRVLLLNSIEKRVRNDLREEQEEFLNRYEDWQAKPDASIESFKAFADQWLGEIQPEDDNFHIFLIEGELYRSNPIWLPPSLRFDSELSRRWQNLTDSIKGDYNTTDPEMGIIFYKAHPLEINGEFRGAFVIAHANAGELRESLAIVYLFVKFAAGVLVVSLILGWFATGQVLKPVKALAFTARSISESAQESAFTKRIPIRGTGELVELSQTFNTMMEHIQRVFEKQRNFMNDAGHELRTPITIIQGHLELMGDNPQDRQETLEIVQDELERMGRMVNEMIQLAKSERSDFLQLETIDLAALTKELYVKAQAIADRNWQLHSICRGQIVGDRQKLTAAMLNLIRNAAQNTQTNAEIEIGSSCKLQQACLWVRDMGRGISLADQTRIFERFARVSDHHRVSDGSGLGLSIVKAITEAHGGYVELQSQLGSGSAFTLVLPIDPPQEHQLS
ncbi:MAG: HAMP domain-containing histidine kinase [Cyanothece sp. SIO1E1]|nr:HAMP domain-containing histidine kinase [Cyanothece sp. SIO1E1]